MKPIQRDKFINFAKWSARVSAPLWALALTTGLNPAMADPGKGDDHGDVVVLAGITPAATSTVPLLRFVNSDVQAGAATVTLYDAGTGAQLATWTSPSLAPFGSSEISVAAIAAAATPPLTAAQSANPVDLSIAAGFHGKVQEIGNTSGAPANLTACGRELRATSEVLGNVAGPGDTTLMDFVRIVNVGVQTQHATLNLYNADDGTSLGSWTSADIPAHASLTVPVSTIATAATPAVPAATVTLTIAAQQPFDGLRLEHLSVATSGGPTADLTSACRLSPGETADADDSASTATAQEHGEIHAGGD